MLKIQTADKSELLAETNNSLLAEEYARNLAKENNKVVEIVETEQTFGKYGEPLFDWWCVVDYQETEVIYRKGYAGGTYGRDYYKYVKNEERARELWELYNEYQSTECPF